MIYNSNKDHNKLTEQLQLDSNALLHWCETNKMHVNILKTKLVTFGTKSSRSKYINKQINMGTQVLEEQQSYKYLGTTLDPYLKMNLHAPKTAHTATYRISLFRKFRHLLTHKAAHLVYTATILPQIEFASLFYTPLIKNLLRTYKPSKIAH